jgi:hypothetical protein
MLAGMKHHQSLTTHNLGHIKEDMPNTKLLENIDRLKRKIYGFLL